MDEELRISDLDPALPLELTDDCVLVINTPTGQTKRTTWGEFQLYAGSGLKRRSFTLNQAQIQALNSAPYEVAPAKVGSVYRAVGVAFTSVYNSATYAADTTLQIGNPSGTFPQMRLLNALNFTGNVFKQLGMYAPAVNDVLFVVGEALVLTTPTTDPTTGDSEITFHVLYEEIFA